MKDATKYFGSDVFVPLTYLYGWEANQVAHTMMGFAGAMLFAFTVVELGWSHWWALLFLVIPILKDTTDYLVDIHSVGGTFTITEHIKKELFFDGVTDCFFWSAGAVMAIFFYFAANSSSTMVYVVLILVGLYVYFGAKKLYRDNKTRLNRFDRSGLPIHIRLPQLRCRFESHDQAVATIHRFMTDQHHTHLVLAGPARSGKTRLCCAIGTHLTTQNKAVYYRTSEKLREDLLQWMQDGPGGDQLQKLKAAEFVICDDALDPYPTDLQPGLQEALGQKRVIWVLARRNESVAEWEQWLKRLFGLDDPPVITIVSAPTSAAGANPPRQPIISHLMSWLTLGTAVLSFFIVFCVLLFF
jgi:hypothetical protein